MTAEEQSYVPHIVPSPGEQPDTSADAELEPRLVAREDPVETVEADVNPIVTEATIEEQQEQRGLSALGSKVTSLISGYHEKVKDTKIAKVTRGVGKLGLLAATAVSYGFEIGPWNEIYRVDRAVEVLQRTESALAVGITVAALTAAIEIVPGGLVALGLNRNKGVMKELNRKLHDRNSRREELAEAKRIRKQEKRANETNPAKKFAYKVGEPLVNLAKKGTDYGIAMGGGSAMLVAARHYRRGRPDLKRGLGDAVIGSSMIAVTSGVIGYLLAGGINRIKNLNVSALDTVTDFVVEHGANQDSWRKLLAVVYGGIAVTNLVTNRREALEWIKDAPQKIKNIPAATRKLIDTVKEQDATEQTAY